MMTGGRRVRLAGWIIGGLLVFALMQVIAWFTLRPWTEAGITIDKPTLVMVSGMGLLFWTVTLSQALESVTRVYYARSDLDLILSSPASSRKLFAVRTGSVALSTILLTGLLASPLINVLAVLDGPQWLAAYGVVIAMGALATAIAVCIT